MSTHISTITTGLKGIVTTVMGSTYTELPYAYSIEDNTRIRVKKGYTVIPVSASQTEGITRNATCDQVFRIILHEFFLSSQSSDSNKNTVLVSLFENMFNIYSSILTNKAGAAAYVLNIKNMVIAQPEILDNKDFVTLQMDVTITHRYSF